MSRIGVITSRPSDVQWLAQALAGVLEVNVGAERADLVVVSDDRLTEVAAPSTSCLVVIGDPASPPEGVAHVITRAWTDGALRDLLVSLVTRQPRPTPSLAPPRSAHEAHEAQRALAAGRRLAGAADLAGFERTAVETVIDLVEADRAYCLYYDGEDGALWSEAKLALGADDRRANAGVVGFAARTGLAVVVEHAGDDPRFVGGNDDPHGDALDRVAVQPVVGGDGQVHALLVATRTSRRAAFGPGELSRLAQLARLGAPVLDQLSLKRHADALLDEAHGHGHGLFRREAIEARAMPRWGNVVRVTPSWVPWAFRILLALLLAAGLFVVFGTVSTYSTGPAIVRSATNTPITARTAGNIVSVEASPGDVVETGAVLARLDDTDQRAAVSRLEHELETQLRNHMLDLADPVADSALRAVRNQLETARANLDERLIRASERGIVGDVRVHVGQHVAPGDIVASIVDRAQRLELIALLPGEDRPQLAPGMELRLELSGYRYVYQSVVIDRVSADVISPGEARRIIGADVAESLELAGPVVLVHGWLPAAEFEMDGRTLRYHDGMRGTAEVRVRSERIVFALVPGARRLR